MSVPTRPRDLQFERDVTEHAAKGVTDPRPLIAHSEVRASTLAGEYVPHPDQVRMGVDRLREAREEQSDARNHIVWWLQDHLDDPRVPFVQAALRHVLLAYDLLGREA